MTAIPGVRTASTRSTRNPRHAGETRADYFANDQPVIYAFKWNSVDIPIPKLAPTSETPHVKTVIYRRLIQNIKRVDTKWTLKTDVLEHLFQTIAPAAGTQAEAALTDLSNYTSAVFEFSDAELLNINLQPLNVNLQNQISAANRRNTKWIRMQLTFRPRSTNAGALGIDPQLFPNSSIVPVYLKAFRTDDELDLLITHDLLRDDPAAMVEIYFESGADFELGQLHRTNNVPDIDMHDRWLREQKSKTKYETLKQLIEPVYVGELEGTETVSKRLYKINQRYYDESTKAYAFSNVEELNQKFQGVLQEIDPAEPPEDLPDICQLFFQATTKNLQDRTVRLLPNGAPVSFNHNLARLNAFVIEVIRQEKEIKSLINIARRASTPARVNRAQHTSGRTFMSSDRPTTPQANSFELTATGTNTGWHSASPPMENTYVPIQGGQHIVLPRVFLAAPNDNPETTQIKTALKHTLTALSLAEQALRDASGSRFPIQCFGCAGLPNYENKCTHLFKDCPHKEDPSVMDNFKKNLQEYRDRRNNQRPRTWRQSGYPNRTMAALVKKLADPTTPENSTLTLLTELHSEMTDEGIGQGQQDRKRPADPNQPLTTTKKPEGRTTRRMGLNFFTYPQEPRKIQTTAGSTFYGQPKHKYEFHLTTNLPFLQLPIGTGEDTGNEATLSGLFDSGGCCNMGWLDYHKKAYEKYPQLIAEFTDLHESQYETFNIGGIKDSIEITHMIKYWLPYQHNGSMATITIGLSPDMPLDTLYGLPFQINAQMTADFANQTVTSKIFRAEFSIIMKRPERTPLESLDYPMAKIPKVLMSHNATQDD